MSDIFELFKKIGNTSSVEKHPVNFLIVGLGNPGKEYEGTRHNMGFMAIDTLASKQSIAINRSRFHALCGEGVIENTGVLLMKPETFMNNSGVAVAEAKNFYKIPNDHIIVLCDDINFEPGRMRIRLSGSSGGHNGLKSIIAATGGEDFIRIKLGVGQKPNPEYDLASWVLGRFDKKSFELAEETFSKTAEAIGLMVTGKAQLAMSQYSK